MTDEEWLRDHAISRWKSIDSIESIELVPAAPKVERFRIEVPKVIEGQTVEGWPSIDLAGQTITFNEYSLRVVSRDVDFSETTEYFVYELDGILETK